jgi:hypothetical protein
VGRVTYLAIRSWRRFQHYHDRRPPWIKVYVEMLDDIELRRLPVTTRLLWDQLLLLAARYDNAIPKENEEIANMTRIPLEAVAKGIETLLEGGWLREVSRKPPASKALAKRPRNARPETETERETNNPPTPLPKGGLHSRQNGTSRRRVKPEELAAPRAVHECPAEDCWASFYTAEDLRVHQNMFHEAATASRSS